MFHKALSIDALSPRRRKTRERLLDAAYEVFSQVGLGGATVDLITEQADFTRGAFYSNYESIEELFADLAVRETEKRLEAVRRGVHDLKDLASELAKKKGHESDREKSIEHFIRFFLELQPDDREWTIIEHEIDLYAMRNPEFAQYLVEQRRKETLELKKVVLDGLKLADFEATIDVEMLLGIILATHSYSCQRVVMGEPAAEELLPSALSALLYNFTRWKE